MKYCIVIAVATSTVGCTLNERVMYCCNDTQGVVGIELGLQQLLGVSNHLHNPRKDYMLL